MKNEDVIKHGFTLIELLVVVLIIGILAAVALPQYQKAVEKSRATQALSLLKSIFQAAHTYYMNTGTYATDFDTLDVGLTEEQKTKFRCTTMYSGCANDEWAIILYSNTDLDYAVLLMRTSGKYEGGGFIIPLKGAHEGKLLCYERTGSGNIIETRGSYCNKLFGGTRTGTYGNGHIYSLP